jgi:hypothetical protein
LLFCRMIWHMTNYECYNTPLKKKKHTWGILACHRFVFFNCFSDFEWLANSKVCNFQMSRIIPENISVILLVYNEEKLKQFQSFKITWMMHAANNPWYFKCTEECLKQINETGEKKTYEGSRSRCIMASGLCSCK